MNIIDATTVSAVLVALALAVLAVVVTADGTRNLSGSLPRTADDVEAWFAEHRR